MRMKTVLAVIFLTATSLLAQTFRGGIVGAVTDKSGATVSGAHVTVVSGETGLVRSMESDSEGNYTFTELPLGTYDVSVVKPGFRTQTVKGVQVAVSQNQRANFELMVGEVEQTVEVSAAVPLIDTTGSSVGGTIESRQVADLPINGRDFIKILGLVPGSSADASAVSDSAGSFGQFSINGNRGRSNNYLLDGTDINDGYRNDSAINEAGVFGTPATLLPIDALETVAVLSGTEAEYGRNSGAIVNLVTKSGTNQLHGSGFEFFRNNALDARNYFNAKPNPQSAFRNNQFGGSLGGAIIKDKTFFFVAYEGQREKVGIPTPSRVPTQDEINAFVDDGGVINPVIQNLLNLHPFTAGQPLPQSNGILTLSADGSNRLDSFIAKIDHHIKNNDVFTGRYFFGDSDQSFPLGLTGGSAVPGFNTVTPTRVQVLSLSYTHVFSPKWLMEVRGGYNRFFETFFPQDRGFDPNSIGLATTSNSQDFGLPLITISGFSSIGANASIPRGRVDTNWQYFTNFSYNTGKHNWKMGFEFRRTVVNQFFDAGYRGKISFDDLDGFLAGNISSGRQASGDSHRVTFQNNDGFYMQDNYRLSSRLTLNYGLRWDYYGVIGEKNNRLSILDTNPTSGGLRFVGSQGLSSLYPKDYNNFGPRVGFAWDAFGSGRTVVRGGWGLAYDAFSQDFFAGQLPFNTFNPGPAFNPGGPSPILFTFSPVSTITAGDPVFPTADFSDSDVFTVSQKLRTPYMQNFNLNVQQELKSGVALQIGYVGSIGRKLFTYSDINQSLPNSDGARPFDNGPFAPSGGTFFYVNEFESAATSSYHSLQTSLNIRNWRGLTSTLNYTWSHSIDTASDGQDFVANASQPDNSFNRAAEKASSNFDIRNAFKWFFGYEFPKTSHQWSSGYGFDGVLSATSGQPFSVTWQFEDDYNGTGEFFGRPDLVGDPYAGTRTPDRFLNFDAFQVPCTLDVSGSCIPGTQHFGNLRRNAFTGPGFRSFDFGVYKNTKLGEKLDLQVRMDFFNILNHPNFSNPVLPNFAVDFLAPNSTSGNFLAITATPDVGIGNPFLGGGGPRNIQLAAKFTF